MDTDGCGTTAEDHAKIYFLQQRGSGGYRNQAGMVRDREERKSRDLVVTGEGREGDGFSFYVFGMMGRRRVTPGWADDPVRRQDGRIRMGRSRDIIWHEGRVGQV